MAILGIEAVVHGVDDLEQCTRFFEDFGLPLYEKTAARTVFKLETGSRVVLERGDSPALPKPWYDGSGAREIVFGVDTQDALEKLADGLRVDREVTTDNEGAAHFYADDGAAYGLRVFNKKIVVSAPDPINSPGNINRVNQWRKWRTRAFPKSISHLVLSTPVDYAASARFLRDRLNFRMVDHQVGFAVFMRADGAPEHHTMALTQAKVAKYHHTAFTVEDVDEIMVGASYMKRHGWNSDGIHLEAGLGRHRVASSLFYYIKSPGGGEVEYGADADHLDDNWIPRVWFGPFGYAQWTHNSPVELSSDEFWNPQLWDIRFDPKGASLEDGYRPDVSLEMDKHIG